MNTKEIQKRISEFGNIRDEAGNDEPALLEVAMFVEDEFGVVLTDDEICQDNLGTYRDIERFVMDKLKAMRLEP